MTTPASDNRSVMPYGLVAFGGPPGPINALLVILALLPRSFRIPILVVQHLSRDRPTSVLPTVLGKVTRLVVKWAEQGERPVGGTVYVAPCDHHLTVAADGSLQLSSSS